MDETLKLLQAAYAAFNRHEADAVLAYMHHEVDWPNAATGGRLRGHEAVRAYWQQQWTTMNPQVQPVRITQGEDGNAVVEVHEIVRDLQGQVLQDRMVQHVYAMQSGLIAKMEIREPAHE